MAEQRGDEQPGTGIQPARPDAPLDGEQLRQFQQFQQFQDYLKFTEAQRQAGGELAPNQNVAQQNLQPGTPGELVPAKRPMPKAPRWLKWLGRKVLAWVIAILLLGIAATWAYNHFFPSDTGKTSAQVAAEGGRKYRATQLLGPNPYETVRMVYDAIGKGKYNPDLNNVADKACGPMREDVQQKFARNFDSPDCRAAVVNLATQVTDLNAYVLSIPSYSSDQPPGDRVTVSSCAIGIRGGPALGLFTVERQRDAKGTQWLITDHAKEPPCSAPTSAASPTG